MADEPADDEQDDSLLQQMLADAAAQAEMRSPSKKPASDPLSSLLESLPTRPIESNKLTPERLAADIDAWIAPHVGAILAQPQIRRLHLAWQGLKELVDQVDFHENVSVAFLSCSKQELADDFAAATSVTESGLYRRLCDRELAPRGEAYSPTSLVVAEYEFEAHQHEIELLSSCAASAADGHAVFLANASPGFFGCEDFSDLASCGDLGRLLEGPRYAAWQSFRDTEDARYVALCLPRAARAFAIQVADSFAQHRGFEALAGAARGGVDGLHVTGEIEHDLSAGGFVALVGAEGLESRFFSACSTYRPARFAYTAEGRAAAADARAAASLANLLSVSRLAHFVEAIATELVPNIDAADLERALQQWLSDPATGAPSLGDAHITVTEPGYLRYELTVRRSEGSDVCTLSLAGRLD